MSKEKQEGESVGNVAKMREALLAIKLEIDRYCEEGQSIVERMIEDPPDYTCLRDSILEINKLINAALAAPARNCDRFVSSEEALSAYSATCLDDDDARPHYISLARFLFAEAKGDSK